VEVSFDRDWERELMAFIICFAGPDGSGKTTLAKRLKDDLEQGGCQVKYVWFRFPRFLTLTILFLARHLNLTEYVNEGKFRVAIHNFSLQPFRTLYPWVVLVDTLAYYVAKIWIPMKLGYTVICDRCVFDILIDVTIDTKNLHLYRTFGHPLFNLFSRKTVTFLVDAPDDVLNSRRPEVNLDPGTHSRRSFYRSFAKSFDSRIVSTTDDVDVVYEKVVNHLPSEARIVLENSKRRKSYANVEAPALQWLFRSKYAILASNWAFQGMLKAVWCERVFRLSIDALITLVFALMLPRFLPWSLLIGFLLGHTFNWLFNGNALSTLKFQGVGYKTENIVKFKEWMTDRLNRNLGSNIHAVFIIGSVARGEQRETSDIDLIVVRLPGLTGSIKANIITLFLRASAFIQLVPLDLFIVDNLAQLKKRVRPDEQPLAVYLHPNS